MAAATSAAVTVHGGSVPAPRCSATARLDCDDSTAPSDWWEPSEPRDIDEPIESPDAKDPTLPTDPNDPTLATDRTESRDHSESTESVDPIDQPAMAPSLADSDAARAPPYPRCRYGAHV